MEEYFLSLKNFKEQIKNIDLEQKYNELLSNNNKLTILNLELESKVKELDTKLKVRDEENASFKKNSLLSSMNKQIDELKNYVSILEKQMKNYKSNSVNILEPVKEPVKEPIKESSLEPIQEPSQEPLQEPIQYPSQEPLQEYETLEYNGKLYYKIKRKIYKINKDKTIGNQYGTLKNGEIIKK